MGRLRFRSKIRRYIGYFPFSFLQKSAKMNILLHTNPFQMKFHLPLKRVVTKNTGTFYFTNSSILPPTRSFAIEKRGDFPNPNFQTSNQESTNIFQLPTSRLPTLSQSWPVGLGGGGWGWGLGGQQTANSRAYYVNDGDQAEKEEHII